jgi:hypothetical protein
MRNFLLKKLRNGLIVAMTQNLVSVAFNLGIQFLNFAKKQNEMIPMSCGLVSGILVSALLEDSDSSTSPLSLPVLLLFLNLGVVEPIAGDLFDPENAQLLSAWLVACCAILGFLVIPELEPEQAEHENNCENASIISRNRR